MEAAKEAISKLTSHHGKNTTEVHEHYRPAVTHEQINPTREHEDTTVVDREVHHDHHHTSVLPIQDQETLPTEHHHRMGAAKHSEHHHGNHKGIHDKVEAELGQFKDQRQVAPTETTRTAAPAIGSEHHHHHVHETIQPIVQKQTIQPSVVHTTIPVHEVHHNEPKHYTASSLPAVSMQEFQSQGGSLTGLADRVERFEGEPDNLAKSGHHGTSGMSSGTTGTSGLSSGTTGASTTSHGLSGNSQTGTTSSGLGNNTSSGLGNNTSSGLGNNTSSGLGNTSSSGMTDTSRSGATASGLNDPTTRSDTSALGSGTQTSRAQQAIDSRVDKPAGQGLSSSNTGSGISGNTSNTTSQTTGGQKTSLLDKLNPFKDSDGDGKKGVGS